MRRSTRVSGSETDLMASINFDSELRRAGANATGGWGRLAFLAQRHVLGTIGLIIMLLFVLTAIFANVISRYDPLTVDSTHRLAAPSALHWFGTDSFGRDVLALKIVDGLDGGIFRNDEHPTSWAHGGAGVGELCEVDEIDIIFVGPIESRDAAVDESLIDVSGDFLSADHVNIQGIIIGRRTESAIRGIDIIAGLFEKSKSRFLEASFRKSDFK